MSIIILILVIQDYYLTYLIMWKPLNSVTPATEELRVPAINQSGAPDFLKDVFSHRRTKVNQPLLKEGEANKCNLEEILSNFKWPVVSTKQFLEENVITLEVQELTDIITEWNQILSWDINRIVTSWNVQQFGEVVRYITETDRRPVILNQYTQFCADQKISKSCFENLAIFKQALEAPTDKQLHMDEIKVILTFIETYVWYMNEKTN